LPAPLRAEAIKEKVLLGLREAASAGIDLQDELALMEFVDNLSPDISGTIGGNTTCLTLETDDLFIIFDAGSGMRELSRYLMTREFGQGKGHAHIFFTHTHWDHIQGFPYFVPAFIPGNQFDIYHVHPYVPEVLKRQMTAQTFPADFAMLPAEIRFHQLEPEQPISLGDLRIGNIELHHPNKAYAYRVDSADYAVVLATDGEYKRLDRPSIKQYLDFYHNADVLIFDAQYSVREAIIKEDWGHSSALIGADIAREAKVKRLVLFHHDPISTDEEILRTLKQTQEYLSHSDKGMLVRVDAATEGMEIRFNQSGNFKIEEETLEPFVRLALYGQFDAQASETFTQHIMDLVQNRHAEKIILDMGGLQELRMAGIRALLDARRNVYSMALVNLSDHVYRVLELAGTADFFAVYRTLDDVLRTNSSSKA